MFEVYIYVCYKNNYGPKKLSELVICIKAVSIIPPPKELRKNSIITYSSTCQLAL